MKSKIVKKNPLLKKLNGFQKSARDRFFLLNMGELTQEEFVLYELGIAITDWDPTHIENYGSFSATNKELAEIIGLESDSSISRVKNRLIKKGYFIVRIDGRIEPKDFERWELRKKNAFSQR